MNKKTKLKLNETLDKALEAPKRKNLSNLDALLSQYENSDQTQTRPEPDTIPTQTNTEPAPKPNQTQTIELKDKRIKLTPAPVRDFNKRANSIDRDALPMGAFPGASKKIYDAVYLRTLGAVVPRKTIQATRREIMAWSGIQNIKTVNAHLKRLKDSGLFNITNFVGEQSGSIYEIFLPEEIGLNLYPDQTQTTQTSTKPESNQKMDSDQTQKMVWVGSGKNVENKDTSEKPKTIFNTLNFKVDDDAPIISHLEKLNEVARKLTGKDLTKKDLEKLSDLTEILVTETVIAAARTGSVSSTVAFMTENLRRRLYSKPRTTKREARPNHLDVGQESEQKSDDISGASPMSLTAEQRQNTLNALKEAKATNSVVFTEFKTYGEIEYTSEDFEWLLENLES